MSDLKQLLESSDILNEESKAVISEAFDLAVEAKTAEIKAEHNALLKEAEEKIISDAAEMIEEAVSNELDAIKDEVVHSRTLEVQYAEKLKLFKESYAEAQEESVQLMINEAVAAEVGEMKDDIEMAKKYQFAMSLYEAYLGVFERMNGAEDVSVVDRLNEAEAELSALKREKKIQEILESVKGEKKDVLLMMLENTATDKLEARFEQLKPIIFAESNEDKEEPLQESAETETDDKIAGTVVLESEVPTDDDNQPRNAELERLFSRSLAFSRK